MADIQARKGKKMTISKQKTAIDTIRSLEGETQGLTTNQKLWFYRKLAETVAKHEPYLMRDYIEETKKAIKWMN